MAKKKPTTLAEYLKIKQNQQSARKDYVNERYKKSLRAAMGLNVKTGQSEIDFIEQNKINIGKYSLSTRIRKHPWLVKGRPASSAIKWLYKEVFTNPREFQYRRNLLEVGQIFTFQYFNPKFKDSLEFFDKYPLVLSLGGIATKNGPRNIGFNLHMLPPKIRIIVICKVFEIYKRFYRYNIFFNRNKPVPITYKAIVKSTVMYGSTFAIRMYIPQRQRVVVKFPLRNWKDCIFLPSRGYSGIKAAGLIKKWRAHVRKLGYSTRENIDWTTKI